MTKWEQMWVRLAGLGFWGLSKLLLLDGELHQALFYLS